MGSPSLTLYSPSLLLAALTCAHRMSRLSKSRVRWKPRAVAYSILDILQIHMQATGKAPQLEDQTLKSFIFTQDRTTRDKIITRTIQQSNVSHRGYRIGLCWMLKSRRAQAVNAEEKVVTLYCPWEYYRNIHTANLSRTINSLSKLAHLYRSYWRK